MIRRSLLCIALAVSLATPALAGGVNFGWNASLGCLPEGGEASRSFACNTNNGWHHAVASFVVTNDQPQFVGIEGIVDLQFQSAGLPAWWEYWNPGSCRASSLAASCDFLSSPQSTCVDPWAGLGAGGIAAYQTAYTSPPVPNGVPNTARIKVAFALAAPSPLAGGTEYYGFRIGINNAKTTGTGACAGCPTAVCLTLTEIKSAESHGGSERITRPITNKSIGFNGQPFVCGATPVSPVSWGRMKGLYR